MDKLLKRLVDSESVSGAEDSIREQMKKELKPYVDSIRTDKVGNLIAKKGKGSPVIMLAAHMDELGMMVKFIEKNGFIRFELLGGWDERIIPAMKVKIHGSKGSVVGIIGTKPPHIQEKEEQKNPFKAKDMFIDIGAKDEKEVAKAGITIGDYVTRHMGFDRLLGTRFTGPGFDNRVGCTVMVEVMKQLKSFNGTVYAVGTIQEETGLMGRASIFSINPDVMLALDTTIGGGSPDIKPSEVPIELGKGPTLTIKDGFRVANKQVVKWIKDTAKKMKIAIQLEVMGGGATDASVAPIIREGIPSTSLDVPVRYVHTPVEVVDLEDMKNTVNLVAGCIKSAGKYF